MADAGQGPRSERRARARGGNEDEDESPKNDDSAEAHRLRSLILAAADSTIEQTIRLQTNQLKPSPADDGIEEIIEGNASEWRNWKWSPFSVALPAR